MGSTTTSAGPISAILFGAPGDAASAATTLDGYPMTRRGEAGRALGASYMSALIGGLFGAALMGISLPLLRPIILFMGSPELLAIAVFGISMVSSLSGNAPLRGLAAACFGMMLAMIGTDPQTGTLRWTMDSLYLWEGLPIVPVTLGIFALPELCDLGIATLLGAFLIHGLVPGPDMLTKHLDIAYSMVWSIALANIVGSGLCFMFSGQLAKLATLRYTLIMPCVLSLIYIGAFEHSRNWGDLYSLLFFGMLGWAMKHFRWPRPPLILGIVLCSILDRYMFISIERYGVSWMLRPIVIVMFPMSILTLTRPMLQDIREHHGIKAMLSNFGTPRLNSDNLFPAALLCIFIVMLALS